MNRGDRSEIAAKREKAVFIKRARSAYPAKTPRRDAGLDARITTGRTLPEATQEPRLRLANCCSRRQPTGRTRAATPRRSLGGARREPQGAPRTPPSFVPGTRTGVRLDPKKLQNRFDDLSEDIIALEVAPYF